ncbi:FAD/NAD(P)-binding protein [Streptomyces millisiae]|uniref:FAD/NAD(P)-binding protein n=1 Tax=Streptomyces millisiae TaxID=3075542 RepID=A0ABU2LKH8_9ACTN|nr:FAD/NAD(P)-binding protein [Streptomyces sp. DSM 44918]MDT0317563.1 FAD/NAD(P)-binding protein [Streptomyces sp. DSM 44918]
MTHNAASPDDEVHLVVVGGGPRGLSLLERVAARVRQDGGSELRIVLVEPYPAGAGKVWRQGQPAELLMNTTTADNTVFPDASVRLDSPVETGPTFLEWLRRIAAEGHPDPGCLAFARSSGERDYAPRRVYGAYLAEALEAVRARLPFRVLADSATGIAGTADGRYLVRLASGGRLTAAAVVLATGHLDGPPAPPAAEGPTLLPGGHPTDYDLAATAPGAEVLLRGGGLNAYDVLALLTEGRGGRHTAAGYRPSGREPRIWITSRRGVPFHARVDTPGVRAPVAHLTPETVDELAARPRLDFRADVLPLLHADLELAWYRRVFAEHPELATAELPALRAAAPASHRLVLDRLAAPLEGRRFAHPDQLQRWFAAHLDADLAAATDPALPPAAALAVAMRQARPALTRLITAGNLTGESYRRDVLGHLNGLLNFFSAGPPARRVRELRALHAAGVVRLLGPATRTPDGAWASTVAPGLAVRPEVVIDAWIPPVDVTTEGTGIVRALIADGVGRPHTLPSATPGGAPLPTGALDARARDGRLRCPGGGVHHGLFAVGVPLEGVRWTTAIGARPGTDAAFFHETDQVAAEVLATLSQRGHLARAPQEIPQ